MDFRSIKTTVLCFVAAGGVIATGISAAHETPKYKRLQHDAQLEKGHPLKRREKAPIALQAYFPTILLGMGTIGCIFIINALNKRQQAQMAQAYLLLNQTYQEYRNAVDEATDEIAMGKVVSHKLRPTYTDSEKISFYFENYGKIFEASMLEVVDAEYQLNRKFAINGYVMVNDFLELLGLPRTDTGNVLGWDLSRMDWIDFDHGVVNVDNMECFVITPRIRPWIDAGEYPLDE